MNVTAILITLVVGVVAGWLAHMIAGGRGSLLGNLCIGLLGSLVGGFLTHFFYFGISGIIGDVIISTIGALVLLALFGLATRRTA